MGGITIGGDDQQPKPPHIGRETLEQPKRCAVRPLEILQDEQHAGSGGLLGQGVEGDRVRRERGRRGILGRAVLAQSAPGDDCRQRRVRLGEPPECAGPRPQRWHPGVGQRTTPADRQVPAVGGEFLDESRLADPRRAADQGQPARTGPCVGEPAAEKRQLRGPPDESIPRRPHLRSIAATDRPEFSTEISASADVHAGELGESGHMNLKTAFVVDPLNSLDASIDTSVGLMHAVQERGAEVWVTEARLLEAVNGRARAWLDGSSWPRRSRWAGIGGAWPTRGSPPSAPRHVWLDEMAAVFIRTEPPLDETFTTATLIFDLIDPARTAMINDPRGIRVCSEHLYPAALRRPHPADPRHRRSDTRSGPSCWSIGWPCSSRSTGAAAGACCGWTATTRTCASLIEIVDRQRRRGRSSCSGSSARSPTETSGSSWWTANPSARSTAIPPPATSGSATRAPRRRSPPATARSAPGSPRRCVGTGIQLAGLDVIGPYLIEVNVTSVGALRKADALLGWTPLRGPASTACSYRNPTKGNRHDHRHHLQSLLAALVFVLGRNVTRNRVITGKAGGYQHARPTRPAAADRRSGRTATRPSTSRSSSSCSCWSATAARRGSPSR